MNKNIFHILVVDDDDRIRELVAKYLEDNNFIVTTAKDAFDAKKKLEIINFDILVLVRGDDQTFEIFSLGERCVLNKCSMLTGKV